ncbi:MAG: MFS transporter [Patescibacteria group bacterium]|nr:MFS transporter [Patescibacteria group bacterium]
MVKRVPGSVYILGAVSFFNDVASEMLYPVMPIFLTQVLGAPVAVVGLIEGVAEGSAAIFKTIFGRWSDRLDRRRPFVFSGYLASAVSKVVIALSNVWGVVFVGRVIDKFGKGLRTGARDALLLDAANDKNRGLIFGVHRTMDSAGAVVGPLIALILLQLFNNNIRTILYIAVIPSLIGVMLISFVRETKKPTEKAHHTTALPKLSFKTLPRELKIFLVASGLFALGNSSDSFLILRSKNLGLSLSLVVLAYVVYNVVYTLASTPAGSIADKIGPKRVFIAGVIVYILVYTGFALNQTTTGIWGLFAVYGLYIALTDGVSKALVGQYVTNKEAAGIYGLLQTITSIGVLLASIIGGLLWTTVGPWATFAFGAIFASLSLLVFLFAKPTSTDLANLR